MRDVLEARAWADHGHAFSESMAGLLTAARTAFERLNAIQFDAPWQRTRAR